MRFGFILLALALAVLVNLDEGDEVRAQTRDEDDFVPDEDDSPVELDPVELIPELESEDEEIADWPEYEEE